jgi:hypothetical protein
MVEKIYNTTTCNGNPTFTTYTPLNECMHFEPLPNSYVNVKSNDNTQYLTLTFEGNNRCEGIPSQTQAYTIGCMKNDNG